MAIGMCAQHRRKCAQQRFIHVYAVWMGGAGGFWDGLPMVSRVSLYAIWMGGAGRVGDGSIANG